MFTTKFTRPRSNLRALVIFLLALHDDAGETIIERRQKQHPIWLLIRWDHHTGHWRFRDRRSCSVGESWGTVPEGCRTRTPSQGSRSQGGNMKAESRLALKVCEGKLCCKTKEWQLKFEWTELYRIMVVHHFRRFSAMPYLFILDDYNIKKVIERRQTGGPHKGETADTSVSITSLLQ